MNKVIKYVLWVSFLLIALTLGGYLLSLGSGQEMETQAITVAPEVQDAQTDEPVVPASRIEDATSEVEGPEPTSQSVKQNEPQENQQTAKQEAPQVKYEAPVTDQDVVRALGDNSSGAKTQFSVYNEYQRTIVGTCPSQRTPNEWEVGDRLAAVGLLWDNLSGAEFDVLNVWDYYDRGGYGGGNSWSEPLYYMGYPQDYRYYRTSFVVALDTLTVTAEGIMADDAEVQAHANRLTNLLRNTVAQYRAKCPNN